MPMWYGHDDIYVARKNVHVVTVTITLKKIQKKKQMLTYQIKLYLCS